MTEVALLYPNSTYYMDASGNLTLSSDTGIQVLTTDSTGSIITVNIVNFLQDELNALLQDELDENLEDV